MQVVEVNPSGQQVCVAASELPFTRSGEQEPKPLGLLVENMLHAVQQRRDLLHFIDQNCADIRRSCRQFTLESRRISHVVPVDWHTGEVNGPIRLQRLEER